MIKPIKTSNITEIASKAVNKATEKISNTAQETSALAANADAELLKAYRGISTKKLFANFSDFVNDFKLKLESFKETISEKLYNQLAKAADENNFSLTAIVKEYYSGLKDSKTLKQVKELYPEIKLPDLNFEEEIAQQIRAIVPKSLCEQISKLSTKEEKQKILAEYFNKKISKQVEKWEIYPEFKKIQKLVSDEIISGSYKGSQTALPDGLTAFNSKMPVRYRLIHTPDREKAYISMLREHFMEGKPISEISLTISDNKTLSGYALRRHGHFPELDKNFRTFIKNSEESAKQFSELASLDTHQINSAIFTQTWTKSRLRADLGNETKFGKDWSLVKPVWQKTMFPDTTYYPTDKLIDTYLLNLFKNGKHQAESPNPLTKYTDNPQMDKNKIMLLKRLYNRSKDLDMDKRILNSDEFKNFKAQFDLESMTKTIESIEVHYKNAFFKRFWTDERKLRFSTALNQNREIASKNIEISEKILTDAMDNVFTGM